jgi:hypothetical protein
MKESEEQVGYLIGSMVLLVVIYCDETHLQHYFLHHLSLISSIALNIGIPRKNLSLKAQDIVSLHPHRCFLLPLLVALENPMILRFPWPASGPVPDESAVLQYIGSRDMNYVTDLNHQRCGKAVVKVTFARW